MPARRAPPERLILDRLATPIGRAMVVTDGDGRLRAFNWAENQDRVSAWIARRYPAAALAEGGAAPEVLAGLAGYFAGDSAALAAISCRAPGTPFQLEVWAALRAIPAGETVSYLDLARQIGRPTAVRAVGLANGANPVAVVVPCHRVIGSDGSLTGYAGGLTRKRWLLTHEGATFRDRLAA